MNAFLNPRNGASLTNIIDVTAHSISLCQDEHEPKISMTYPYLKHIVQYPNRLMFK